MTTTLINGDCIEVMPTLTQKFDMVFADPPYGIKWSRRNLNYNISSRIENFVPGYQEVKEEDYAQFSRSWISAIKGVCKKDCAIYIATGWNNKRHILNALAENGFTLKSEIVWQYAFGVYKTGNYIDAHQTILYAIRGHPKFYTFCRTKTPKESYYDRHDIWNINRIQRKRGEPKTAPMMPEAVVEKALQYSTIENQWVLDPFAGTGTTAATCRRLKRHCITIEKNTNFITHIQKRLEK